jgi:peptidoglycan/LPS O-acetylase OafA/YrhL
MGSAESNVAKGEPGGLGHVRSLDGMRAVAVILVFLFHLGVPGFDAGYLGVDVFFVLSGFLITSLLIAEMDRTGRIQLLAFWARRARRLLPALVVLLLVVAFVTHLTATFSERASMRSDLLAATGYVANWRFIAAGSYFANTGVDSPIQHTWSLAIEEQFYLCWPLLLAGVLALVKRPRMTVIVLATAGGIASVLALALLYDPTAVDRAYMGTDARIFEPMIGALGAALVTSPRVRPYIELYGAHLVALGGLGIVAGLAVIRPDTATYYRGGAVLFSVATLLVLMPLWVGKAGRVARALDARPLVWLGVVSYGVYLWHWPIILWLHLRDASGSQAFIRGAAVVGLTLSAAAVSYYAIERPIRRGRRLESHKHPVRRRRPGLVLACVPVVLLLVAFASVEATRVPSLAPGTPVIMLVGDSVPEHLQVALEEALRPRGWRVVSSAHGACSASGDTPVFGDRSRDPAKCSAVIAEQDRMVRDSHPDVIVWWDRWSLTDLMTPAGEVIRSGTDRFWQYRQASLEAAVKRLTAQGGRVVLVATEPPGEAVTRRLSGCTDAQCRIWLGTQVNHYTDITTKWNALMRGFALHHPALASYISITGVICKTDVSPCDDLIGGVPARVDGVHYVGAGQEKVVGALLRRIVPIVLADRRHPLVTG